MRLGNPKITEWFLAGLKNQRMVGLFNGLKAAGSTGSQARSFGCKNGSITCWAWAVSIGLHLIVLAVFGVVRFSQSNAQNNQGSAPRAKVSRIKEILQATTPIPKPKVKSPTKGRFTAGTKNLLPTEWIISRANSALRSPPDFAKAASSQSVSLLSGVNLSGGIEFFGSWTPRRKVCYVVDCSGSMRGIFERVKERLAGSIKNLQPDQYFHIIFFGDNRLLEFGGDRLVRATEQTKSAAYDFIKTVEPGGRTNALAALQRALQIRDESGDAPSLVYFLTDGFELTSRDTQRLPQKMANLLRRFAPDTKINTIGFWPAEDDRKMLKIIAEQSGGEFVSVTDENY